MSLRYLVIIEKTDTGYSAYVPDLPGCITIGDTKKEVEANMQEAIILHLEGMQEDEMAISTLTTDKIKI